jgi:hypothetical protein
MARLKNFHRVRRIDSPRSSICATLALITRSARKKEKGVKKKKGVRNHLPSIDLLMRVTTVSVRTVAVVEAMRKVAR